MNNFLLIWPIIVPLVAGLLTLVIPNRVRVLKEIVALLGTLTGLVLAVVLYRTESTLVLPWFGWGIEFSLRLYSFSAFILLAITGFSFLITLYSTAFLKKETPANQFYAYLLLTVAMASGVVLANNLILLLFFWEGLLLTLFGLIIIGRPDAGKTAIKAFIIIGITDLCLLFGIALTGNLAGTFDMTKINLPLKGYSSLAFILLMIGAIAKSGSMPFHSWIPDAAIDAPLPFMALIPGAFEKLLGIYLLTRIAVDLFALDPTSWVSYLLMTIGGLTIIFAVMMALVQKDYKRLLSYHAISQVGYMILGIGTALPVGIIGGLFHMINNALYKSCLFLSGGSVEKETGTTDLGKLGGLFPKMPVTAVCFIIAAVSISGVPPFNGFFSKELVYDAALERGWIFYLLAVVGSFFTAASFLKLGHAAFFGKRQEGGQVKEAPWAMLLPMIVLALVCIIFGLYNYLPISLLQPVLGSRLEGHSVAGFPTNMMLVALTVIVLLGAILNHYYGVKRTGKGVGAVDHIHYAPVLSGLYDKAEKRWFDPYEIGIKIANWFSYLLWLIDRLTDWVYEKLAVWLTFACTGIIRWAHSGNFSTYVVWSLVGSVIILYLAVRGM